MMPRATAEQTKDVFLFFCSLFSFALMLSFPSISGEGVRSGLTLCSRAVIPSVFPSLVLTDLLFSFPGGVIEKTIGRPFSRVFRVPLCGATAWAAGLLCGFPVGAISVASSVRDGRLSREEGEYLLCFVNNTGPAFLVGGVGVGLFGSASLGWKLYLLQIPVSLFVGLFFRPSERAPVQSPKLFSRRRIDPVSAVVRASEACVRIVGFVCFFSVLTSLLSMILPDGLPLSIASSFLEVGNASSRAARLTRPFPAVPLVAFSVCFSGLSVHFQTLSALKDTGLGVRLYWKGKIAGGLFAFLLASLFCLTN